MLGADLALVADAVARTLSHAVRAPAVARAAMAIIRLFRNPLGARGLVAGEALDSSRVLFSRSLRTVSLIVGIGWPESEPQVDAARLPLARKIQSWMLACFER